jgi:hypothetical protein
MPEEAPVTTQFMQPSPVPSAPLAVRGPPRYPGRVSLERENARLLAQAAALSGDADVLRSALPWRDAEPAERLAAADELFALVPALTAGWSDDMYARARSLDRFSPDTIEILRRMRTGA